MQNTAVYQGAQTLPHTDVGTMCMLEFVEGVRGLIPSVMNSRQLQSDRGLLPNYLAYLYITR